MGSDSRPCARAERLGGHRVAHLKFKRAVLVFRLRVQHRNVVSGSLQKFFTRSDFRIAG
jgi:hypothetical protein